MNIAEKLALIAENMPKVYEAGRTKGIDIRTVSFETWHNGTSASTLVQFEHGLGTKPRFVCFIADDMTALETAETPSNITSIICQADGLCNLDTGTRYPVNFIRRRDGAFGSSARDPNDGSGRLIADWDDKYIHINANGSAEAWPPASVTTFTLICIV